MKVLLYAFSPFGKNTTNISEQVLNHLPDQANLFKHVFLTTFDKNQFLKVAEKYQPELIIGLGQYPSGDKLRIETTAYNSYRSKSHPKTEIIDPDGSPTLSVNFELPTTSYTAVTDNAGRYVCNYSMYVLGRWAVEHHAKFCFLHIPKAFPADRAVHYLSQILENQL